MVKITDQLIRKRSEHNEGEIFSLEEISLHQQDIEKIELLEKLCRELKILYLQNNLISRIENVGRLKRLEYLNLALNNIEIIENLEGCENLQKLDLTLNFIGELTSLQNLKDLVNLEELYLTGNPCADFKGYREYVIATLLQIKKLDGIDITKSERIIALQNYKEITDNLCNEQQRHAEKRKYEKTEAEKRKQIIDNLHIDENNVDSAFDDFWNEKVAYSPESRWETHNIIKKKQLVKDNRTNLCPEKKEKKLFAEDGRPYNMNEAKIGFSLIEELDESENPILVLKAETFKHLDIELISCDVQTTYVRITQKNKIFQLALPNEVNPDTSKVTRSQTTGHMVVSMPLANPDSLIKCKKRNQSSKSEEKHLAGIGLTKTNGIQPATTLLEVGDCEARLDWRNIVSTRGATHHPINSTPKCGIATACLERANSPDFIDDPSVPPLL